jgi:hypothetical protein
MKYSLKKSKIVQPTMVDYQPSIDFASFGLLFIDEEERKATEQKDKEEELSDLPLLVPVGEVISPDCNSGLCIELPRKEAEDAALVEKGYVCSL